MDQRALSDKEFRSLYNLLYRLTGSRSRAKSVLAQAVTEGTPDDPATWRERLVSLLGPEETNLCLLRRARELLTTIPSLPTPLPDPQRQGTAFEHAVKDSLPPAYLALIELAFVEERSAAQIGELLGVGEPLVLGFLASFLDSLSGTGGSGHSAACPTAWETFAHAARGTTPDRQPPCTVCQRGLVRALAARKALSRDTRIVSFSDQAFIKKALAAPKPDLSQKPWRHHGDAPQDPQSQDTQHAAPADAAGDWKKTPAPALRADERKALFRALAPVLALPALMGFLWIASHHTSSDGDGPLGTFATGLATVSGTVLGTVSDGVGPARALLPHSTVQAASDRSLTLSLHSGLDIILWPGAKAMVAAGDVEILSGKARLMTPVGAQVGERIRIGALSGLMQEGDLLAMNAGDSPTRFHVRTGRIRVHGGTQHWNLGPGDLLSSIAGGAGYKLGAEPATDVAFRPPSPESAESDQDRTQ